MGLRERTKGTTYHIFDLPDDLPHAYEYPRNLPMLANAPIVIVNFHKTISTTELARGGWSGVSSRLPYSQAVSVENTVGSRRLDFFDGEGKTGPHIYCSVSALMTGNCK